MRKTLLIMLISGLGLTFIYRKNFRPGLQGEVAERRIAEYLKTTFQNGDIVFQTSTSTQSRAIQLATNSKYSHMGIIYETDGQFYVYEAVQPVKLTKLNDWIKRGENSRYVVKRLKNSEQFLTKENLKKMKTLGRNLKVKLTTYILSGLTTKSIVQNLFGRSIKERLILR